MHINSKKRIAGFFIKFFFAKKNELVPFRKKRIIYVKVRMRAKEWSFSMQIRGQPMAVYIILPVILLTGFYTNSPILPFGLIKEERPEPGFPYATVSSSLFSTPLFTPGIMARQTSRHLETYYLYRMEGIRFSLRESILNDHHTLSFRDV
jgi:hypothetical protein